VGGQLLDVTRVSVLGHWRLLVTFEDGFTGSADLSDLQDRGGVFEALRDPAVFAQAFVDPEQGTVAWPNGADIAPESLRRRAAEHALRDPKAPRTRTPFRFGRRRSA